jgi:1-acyl-sn-glycerol-3-phosphate acyltransferase
MNYLIIILALALIIALIIRVGLKHNQANWGHPMTNVLDGWLRLYCKRYHRLGNQTIEIPEQTRCILASNHLSALDPFLLIAAIDRPVRFMIAKEEYEKPLLKWMFKAAGCIPVDRTGRVEKAFRSALRAINSGELVALFPQGGIHSAETPRERIKPGIIRLSQLTKCQILPVRIRGISAPGTMVECLYKRSHTQLDVESLIPVSVSSDEHFKQRFADWLIVRREKLSTQQ